MSHKRKSKVREAYNKQKKNWEEAQSDAWAAVTDHLYGPTPSMKRWILEMITIVSILFIIGAVLWFLLPWVGSLLLIMPVMLSIFLAHESLHWFMARSLNYDKLEWFNDTIAFIPFINKPISIVGFDVLYSDKEQWSHDKWKIALAPYIIIMPLSLLMVLLGYSHSNSTLLYAGILSLIFHVLLVLSEGRSIKE